MSDLFPPTPALGDVLPASLPSPEARHFLAKRRSIGKRALSAPGPTDQQLNEILYVAGRVPDHRRLAPWRFLVFQDADRDAFNAQAVAIQKQENADASEAMLADTASYFTRAPVVIAVISSPDHVHKTPVWEQELSCGAVCYNLLLAANAAGWAGCWLTEWIAFSQGINALLGLSETERIAGFIYLGTATADPTERLRPDIGPKIQRWSAAR